MEYRTYIELELCPAFFSGLVKVGGKEGLTVKRRYQIVSTVQLSQDDADKWIKEVMLESASCTTARVVAGRVLVMNAQ